MPPSLDFHDPEWVAEQLNIDKNAVYRYLNDGVLPGLQLGRKWLISESTLVEFLKGEEARQTLERRTGLAVAGRRPGASLLDRFSDQALRALVAARALALGLGHNWVGQEHLLSVIARNPGPGVEALFAAGGSSGAAVAGSVTMLPALSEPVGGAGLTPRLQKALALAITEAEALGDALVGTEHLLLGILAAGEGLGYDALAGSGLSLAAARGTVAALPPTARVHPTPAERGFGYEMIRAHLAGEPGEISAGRPAPRPEPPTA